MGLPIDFAECRDPSRSESVSDEQTRQRRRDFRVPGFVDLIFHFGLGHAHVHVVTRSPKTHGVQAQEKILRTFHTSTMNKRLPQGNDHQMDNSKKRKRSNKVSGSGPVPENITSARHLQGLLGDFSTQEALNDGQNIRIFWYNSSKLYD